MKNVQLHGINPNLMFTLYFFAKMIPALISGLSIYLGYKLFILGVTGQASLSIESKEISGQLLNAAPGLFFAIGGIVSLIVISLKGFKLNFDSSSDVESGVYKVRGNSNVVVGRDISISDE
ncbi:hypothetical protein [Amphritea sp.]|uniref:hypothetical protein n=1 Tax=Amphritea sp. TaxID=1872502 RepID=UPI003D0B13FB